ncbi:tetratricopeptide repeat protein [Methanolobus psychrotolerans]|uniref:tetratricopeptide repeat protein n=1 Tax=Methanolobus psychrotolerans TaxID=1874706 RepID=UPI000B915E67|nr:tetratricopeptide repeat protein [Methanolobus psychrotolerans]
MDENTESNIKNMLANNLRSMKEHFHETPSMENLFQIVAKYHEMEQTERGIGFAEAFLMQIEDEKDRLLQTSMVLEVVEKNEEALSYLVDAEEKFPDDALVKNHRAMLLNKLSEFEKALSIYDGLLEADPKSLESLSGKLVALTGLVRHGDILKLYKTSIAITPSTVQDWHFKGVIDGILKDYFEHEKGASITDGQAEKLSKSFDSIFRIIDGLDPEVRNFYMMGNFAGKGIYHEIIEKKD